MRIEMIATGMERRNEIRPTMRSSTRKSPNRSLFWTKTPTAPSIAVRPIQ